ncbi:MAG: hypothetical protein A3H32_15115 [Betaproteobacteria bacterium RIFCSPLOWO2_02_FULL_63_19]|nr:MAG: hypothetical protein A3H32_15115 [Betaproteobacteria bacterium RIFCSPLOWO2_02_FULL_63_19]
MDEWTRLGLINALLARQADTPATSPLSSLSSGLLGLDRGLGLPSISTPPLRLGGALEQYFAKSEHDRLVERLHSRLVANLYSDIKVDLPGYEKPTRIVWTATQRGHEPDASAYYGFKQHIFEVETADSIGDEHTREQCELFAAYARGRAAEFTLVVPVGCGAIAVTQLNLWGLDQAVLEI